MSGKMKMILATVMIMALTLIAILGDGILRDYRTVQELKRELSESRATWEDIAERKEALQAELKMVTEELKEARLTLEESTNRAEELREDIVQLETEIASLKVETGDDLMNQE